MSSFFSNRLVSVQVVHPYSSIDTTAAWKKLRFILSVRFDFHKIESLSITVHAFVSRTAVIKATGDTDFFDIVTRVLQGDTLASYQFIFYLRDVLLQMSTDIMKENKLEVDDIPQKSSQMQTTQMV